MLEPPLCFTVLRDSVDRVISFYYERVEAWSKKALNDFTATELDFYMREFYGSAYSKHRDEVSPGEGSACSSASRSGWSVIRVTYVSSRTHGRGCRTRPASCCATPTCTTAWTRWTRPSSLARST